MRIVNTSRAASYLAIAALGVALSQPTTAAPSDDLVVITQSASRRAPGTTDQVVSLTQHVSYADLDLSTTSGAKQLALRVHQVANSLCDELERRSALPDLAETLACVKGAVTDGMEHARAAIAAADKRSRAAGVTTSR
jgi:UrcA family protein